ncbi:unnamed protein product [Amoebophrya sp. A25]|nr:unnamed protein product [Amoebophrya sp. A25]|eukprot:GSA25T00021244001.1
MMRHEQGGELLDGPTGGSTSTSGNIHDPSDPSINLPAGASARSAVNSSGSGSSTATGQGVTPAQDADSLDSSVASRSPLILATPRTEDAYSEKEDEGEDDGAEDVGDKNKRTSTAGVVEKGAASAGQDHRTDAAAAWDVGLSSLDHGAKPRSGSMGDIANIPPGGSATSSSSSGAHQHLDLNITERNETRRGSVGSSAARPPPGESPYSQNFGATRLKVTPVRVIDDFSDHACMLLGPEAQDEDDNDEEEIPDVIACDDALDPANERSGSRRQRSSSSLFSNKQTPPPHRNSHNLITERVPYLECKDLPTPGSAPSQPQTLAVLATVPAPPGPGMPLPSRRSYTAADPSVSHTMSRTEVKAKRRERSAEVGENLRKSVHASGGSSGGGASGVSSRRESAYNCGEGGRGGGGSRDDAQTSQDGGLGTTAAIGSPPEIGLGLPPAQQQLSLVEQCSRSVFTPKDGKEVVARSLDRADGAKSSTESNYKGHSPLAPKALVLARQESGASVASSGPCSTGTAAASNKLFAVPEERDLGDYHKPERLNDNGSMFGPFGGSEQEESTTTSSEYNQRTGVQSEVGYTTGYAGLPLIGGYEGDPFTSSGPAESSVVEPAATMKENKQRQDEAQAEQQDPTTSELPPQQNTEDVLPQAISPPVQLQSEPKHEPKKTIRVRCPAHNRKFRLLDGSYTWNLKNEHDLESDVDPNKCHMDKDNLKFFDTRFVSDKETGKRTLQISLGPIPATGVKRLPLPREDATAAPATQSRPLVAHQSEAPLPKAKPKKKSGLSRYHSTG